MNIPLSDKDILKLTKKKCSIYIEEDLRYVKNIDTLFKYNNCAVILLDNGNPDVGHWIVMTKISNDTIEYFDPVGLPPDFISKKKYLRKLIDNSHYKYLIYNGIYIQKVREDINTCGRYVALRIMLWNDMKCTLKEYLDFLTDFSNPDISIVRFTRI